MGSNPLFSELEEITSSLQISVTNQQGNTYNRSVSTETDDQGSVYPVPNLVILSAVSPQVHIYVCKCLFWNPSEVIFLNNRHAGTNLNIYKGQETVFNIDVEKSHTEGVC
jgi:hypothetical protein